MSYSEQKKQLQESLLSISEMVNELLPESPAVDTMGQLLADIKNDYYTIVVVGEFKHGKSTFVNALLGESLMPVDVTPTTATINALFYGENRELHVVKTNGDVEKKELSEASLSQYVASADFNPDDIKYLKIFLPSPLLKNNVVLVDTPGVNDLNQQRSEITHQFIPRADAVLFMVDMRTPIKATEEKFLKDIMKKDGIHKILYAANFLDRIDEEEIEELTEFIERRIQHITRGDKPSVFPFSALEGLEGKLENNEEVLGYSGLIELEAGIGELLNSGTRSQDKLQRFSFRRKHLLGELAAEIETVKHFSNQSIEQLESQLASIGEWFAGREQWYQQIHDYIVERENEIKLIVRKSVQYFGVRLKKDISNKIDLFHGGDIRPFIEKQLPFTIKSQFEQWLDQYNEQINHLFAELAKEVSKGLSESFKSTVKIHADRHGELEIDPEIPFIEATTGNASVKAGLVIGGASTIALLLGGSFFIPLVGMAGLPFLQNKIMQKQLENIKPQLQMSMDEQLTVLIESFNEKLDQYIESSVRRIEEQTTTQFEQQVSYLKTTIDEQIREAHEESSKLQDKLRALTALESQIGKIVKEGVVENDERISIP